MARVAVDLSPVVTSLLERPFDRPSLDRAYAAVGGHPQAYATALRCAAKKAPDSLAAAYWFAEAARIHETMDDLGGAIALLWRAHECDRKNPVPREHLAATMVRLAMRAGLGFTFTAESRPPPLTNSLEQKLEPAPVDTGLRPSPFESHFRDTVPEVFGSDGDEAEDEAVDRPARVPTLRATLPSAVLRPANLPRGTELAGGSSALVALAEEDAELEELEEEDLRRRVEQLLPPPKDVSAESGVVQLSRTPSGEPVLRALEEAEPARASEEKAPSPVDPTAGEGHDSDVYATDDEVPPTLRPAGDRLVGGVFEVLHGLHFIADVRHGASFVCRTLSEKMRASSTLVHLYDINSGHFLIVSADGNRAAALSDYATNEDDPLILQVMKSDDALLVQDPANDPRFGRGRWALAEPKRSVLCAPIASEGRPLGLIELADPEGGVFTEDDKNAVMYAASALSRFLTRRGLVLSDEPERSSPGPIPQ